MANQPQIPFDVGRTGTVVYDVNAREYEISTSDVIFHKRSLYIGAGLSY